jgi:hypothetical protein
VVLATGGAGSMFQTNVTPPSQTGDGWAMAYDAGCRFVNMEFFQIGPAVAKPRMKFIIHSHMWRMKPRLTNGLGEEFLPAYCPPRRRRWKRWIKGDVLPFSVRTAQECRYRHFQGDMAGPRQRSGAFVSTSRSQKRRSDDTARRHLRYAAAAASTWQRIRSR